VRHIPSWVPWLNYESLAQKGRELSSRMANEPFKFVRTAMVRSRGPPGVHVWLTWLSQQDGTAVQSLASEHLQEIENLATSERQEQEMVVKKTLASMYMGEILWSTKNIMLNLSNFFDSWFGHSLSSRLNSGTSNNAYYVKTVSSLTSLFLALVLYQRCRSEHKQSLTLSSQEIDYQHSTTDRVSRTSTQCAENCRGGRW
jgi:hypothetical protein